jgi:hypothetical protein
MNFGSKVITSLDLEERITQLEDSFYGAGDIAGTMKQLDKQLENMRASVWSTKVRAAEFGTPWQAFSS